MFWIIKDSGGTGSFMCPPGHPAHRYSLYGYSSPQKASRWPEHANYIGALSGALELDGEAPEVARQARDIFAAAATECSEDWLRHVYGYFRNCYSPDGADRDTSRALIWDEGHGKRPPAGRHLAVLAVREFFPDHEPREDLIADPGRGYGSWPCDRCGRRVQYEARLGCHAEILSTTPWKYGTECGQGGRHEVSLHADAPPRIAPAPLTS